MYTYTYIYNNNNNILRHDSCCGFITGSSNIWTIHSRGVCPGATTPNSGSNPIQAFLNGRINPEKKIDICFIIIKYDGWYFYYYLYIYKQSERKFCSYNIVADKAKCLRDLKIFFSKSLGETSDCTV